MSWNLLVTGPAQKQLRRIPERNRERVNAALLAIEDEPFSGDLVRLRAQPAAMVEAGGYSSDLLLTHTGALDSRERKAPSPPAV